VKELDDIANFIVPVMKIALADTGYLSMGLRRLLPDMYNMIDIQNAKALAQELMISDMPGAGTNRGASSAPVLILDYAAARPDRISYSQIQNAVTQILQNTLPYLSAEEMREVWGVITEKISKKERTEQEEAWMDYLGALCSYDLPEIRRLSLELLPDDGDISKHYSNQMLIASLLASSAALGDYARIERAWYRYEERNDPPAPIRAAKSMLTVDW
jgi:hypothetical protein